jgi:hypothetical protein
MVERAKTRLKLSETAAASLDEIKKADPDIGEADAFGEVLPPDNVKEKRPERTQDEENDINTEEISPLMRAAIDE